MKPNVVRIRYGEVKKIIELGTDEFLIGRDESAALRLQLAAISRRHVLVRIIDGNVLIRDLGSANGTFLGATRLRTNEEIQLPVAGTEFSLGNAVWVSVEPREAAKAQANSTELNAPPKILELDFPAQAPTKASVELANRALLELAENLKNEIFSLRTERVQCERELANKRKSIENDLTDLKTERANMEQEVAQKRTEVDKQLSVLKEHYGRSALETQTKLKQLESERERVDHSLAELSALQKKSIAEYEQKMATIEGSISAMTANEAIIKKEFEAVLDRRDEAVMEMEHLKQLAHGEIETAAQQRDQLKAEAELTQQETRKSKQENIRLRTESTAIEAEILDIRERREKLKKQVNSLEEEHHRTELALTELKAELKRQSDLHELEVRKSKALGETLEAELQVKKLNLEALISELNLRQINAKRELQATQVARETTEKETEQLKAEALRRTEEAAARAAEAEALLLDARTKTAELEALKIQIDDLQAAKRALDSELGEARGRMEKEIEKERARRNEALQNEFQVKATQAERDIAESRLEKMKEIDKLQSEASATFRARREFMLNEIVKGVSELSKNGDVVKAETDIERLVRDVLEGKTVGTLNAKAQERTRKFWKKSALVVAVPVAAALILAIFPQLPSKAVDQLNRTIASEKSEGSVFLDEIKQKGMKFQPETDRHYRSTYTDNILYLDGYAEMKFNPEEKRKWTLVLNDFIVGRLGLSDRIITDVISTEAVMVTELFQIREGILPQFKEQGLARMAETEKQYISRLTELLQGPENYQKFRNLEKSYYDSYMEHHK